jgi:hypothetical protein
MAANMGMAGNGHLLMQQQQQQQQSNGQRQLQQHVYAHLVQNTPAIQPGGWQAGLQINDRLGKIMTLYVSRFDIAFSPWSELSLLTVVVGSPT